MTDHSLQDENNSDVNTVFWVIGIIALLWNLMGVLAFGYDMTISQESLELMSEEQRALYTQNPLWLKIIYGTATIGGLAASIGLLMKKKWCIPLFLLSLVAIVIQFGYSVFGTDAVSTNGYTSLILPVIVVAYGAFLWHYSKKCDERGWLS